MNSRKCEKKETALNKTERSPLRFAEMVKMNIFTGQVEYCG